MTDADPILRVIDVHRRFGNLRAVDGTTFDVARGSITALIGPNGAGKTTVFDIISGFLAADRGSIVYDGRAIGVASAHTRAREGLVRTFQHAKALARMSVIDNMLLAGVAHPGERLAGLAARPRAGRRYERDLRERALERLDDVGLGDKSAEYAGTLSGGQRKLLELARALMLQPRLLLLDEPMAGINRSLGARLMEQVQRLRAREQTTFLFIEHDMDTVMTHADEIIVMANGRVIATGDPRAVRSDERVLDAYLGGTGGKVAR